ncbi:MAG: hypothetical protein IKW91_04850 [Bacteroidaceae bacterium]|nr:hypothetical protein [Bacteroidaceae bacterium]
MAEYAITGIRYSLWKEGSLEERTRLTEEFLSRLESGTPMMLVAEPDNIKDSNAIAAYTTDIRKVGYIKHECCGELKPLLEPDGRLLVQVSRNDGHVTFFVEVPDVKDEVLPPQKGERVLPESPLPTGIFLPFTEEERALQVVAPLLCGMKFTAENAAEWLKLTRLYMPLSRLSLSREDDCWRDRILKKLRAAMRLKMAENEKRQLEQLRDELVSTQADFHRSGEHWQQKVFDAQLRQLKAEAEREDGLFERFENHVKQEKSGLSSILVQLKDWFKAMPHASLCDCMDHQKLAETLNYQGVSRRELYDVYAAVLLLERYQSMQESIVCKLTPMFYGNEQEAKDFLAGIGGLKPKEITYKVNQLVRDRKISRMSCRRDLWKVLHDCGLYKPTESNWNQQII